MFKEGDVVVCTSAAGMHQYVTEGKEYTVRLTYPDGVQLNGVSAWLWNTRFKLKENKVECFHVIHEGRFCGGTFTTEENAKAFIDSCSHGKYIIVKEVKKYEVVKTTKEI